MSEIIKQLLLAAINTLKNAQIVPNDIDISINIERPKNSKHGDFSTNLALILAKQCKLKPIDLANHLIIHIKNHEDIEKIEIAGNGFINFFMKRAVVNNIIKIILQEQEKFGSANIGKDEKILLEFVSSNPTGPLHVGHGRGAAFGASMANILRKVGFTVICEYYVNDAGRQMDILALSVWLRYLELLKEKVNFPEKAYRGAYIVNIAKICHAEHQNKYYCSWNMISSNVMNCVNNPEKELDILIEYMRNYLKDSGFKIFYETALANVLADIKDDLSAFGVYFDNWISEKSLLDNNIMHKCLCDLQKNDHAYYQDDALWFRAIKYGDEKDRVLIRANGQPTYFAVDAAYHWHKYSRGFNKIIDIFGSDHHGYVERVRAVINAMGHNPASLTVLLVQFVVLYRGKERVQMSTRSGSFVTLRQLREEVGNDAARFFYVMRKNDQHVDFDLDLAKSKSNDNPVYYIQYAHARIASVFRQLNERNLLWNMENGIKHIHYLDNIYEINLIGLLNSYPELIKEIANNYEPHLLVYYLKELATHLHAYYNNTYFLDKNINYCDARLCLIRAIQIVLHGGLSLLGVTSPESM